MKTTDNLIPLRLYVGLTTVLAGAFLLLAGPNSLTASAFKDENAWMWAALLALFGTWMAVSAGCEVLAEAIADHPVCVHCLYLSDKMRASGYFLGGSVWAGVGMMVLFDGRLQLLDLIAPVQMAAMFYFSLHEARSRLRQRNAAAGPDAVPHPAASA
jgi:hypothetical protein